jgi:Mn-containing catalase
MVKQAARNATKKGALKKKKKKKKTVTKAKQKKEQDHHHASSLSSLSPSIRSKFVGVSWHKQKKK